MDRTTSITVLTDVQRCREITARHPQYFTFDVEQWFSNSKNVCFIERENLCFAEYKKEGVYWVHFCFDSAKGREAIELAKTMRRVFLDSYDVSCLIGLIRVNNKKAKFVVRQIGFKSLGEVETSLGLCEMFYYKE
jgi:hypothetical protein